MASIGTTFYYNQVLSGIVDGSNKTFTSPYPIGVIDDMRIGGASYASFSFVEGSTTVTLADAPTIILGSPYIDFFLYSAVPAQVGTAITFGDIIDETYTDKLGHGRDSEQFLEETVKRLINEGSRVMNNVRTNPKYKLNSYSFNPTGPLRVTTYSATEINVGSIPTNCPSSGFVIFPASQPIRYTSLDTESFLGLTGLDFVYVTGGMCNVAYKLPAAAKKVSGVYVGTERFHFVDFRLFVNEDKSYNDELNRFTVWRDNSTGDEYIVIPATVGKEKVVTVHYSTINNQYTDDTDLIDFEPEYRQLLSLYAAYKICLYKEDDRWQTFKLEFNEEWNKYRSYLRRTDGTQAKIVSTALNGF